MLGLCQNTRNGGSYAPSRGQTTTFFSSQYLNLLMYESLVFPVYHELNLISFLFTELEVGAWPVSKHT